MSKIIISERQAKLVQELSVKNKRIKITESQYSRIVENQSEYFKNIPKLVMNKVSILKNLIDSLKDSDGDSIGVIDSRGTWQEPFVYSVQIEDNVLRIIKTAQNGKQEVYDEYDFNRDWKNEENWILTDCNGTLSDLIRQYKRTFKKLQNQQNAEQGLGEVAGSKEPHSFDLLDFINNILATISDVITDPTQQGLSPFWTKLGVTRPQLFGAMADFGLITTAVVGGRTTFKLIQNNFKKNVKNLFKYFESELKPDQLEEDYPLGAANDPQAPYNRPDAPEQNQQQRQVKTASEFPFKLVWYKDSSATDQLAIFSKDGYQFVFPLGHLNAEILQDYSEKDVANESIDAEAINNFVNDNAASLKIGEGVEAFENNYTLCRIDDALKQLLLKYYGQDESLVQVLNTVHETTTTGSVGGSYVQLAFLAKDKANHRFAQKPMYTNGTIVEKFVEFDDCTKLNNNKEAENGGCSQGAVDNVVKIRESLIAMQTIAKKSGKSLQEVHNIIKNKQK